LKSIIEALERDIHQFRPIRLLTRLGAAVRGKHLWRDDGPAMNAACPSDKLDKNLKDMVC
jgi:hypothetical protein